MVLVDHDVQLLREAEWLIELGPGSGGDGGTVVASGTVDDLASDPASSSGASGGPREAGRPRNRRSSSTCKTPPPAARHHAATHRACAGGREIPQGRLTAITGVSGSGKTTLVLESLAPGLQAAENAGGPLPAHVARSDAPGIGRVNVGRHADRHERPLDRRDVQRGAGRPAPRLRPPTGRASGAEGVRLLLQHRIAAAPALRGHRAGVARRAVSARRRHPVPRLRGQPVRDGGVRRGEGHEGGGRPVVARAAGPHGAGGVRGAGGPEEGPAQAADPHRSGARPDARRRHRRCRAARRSGSSSRTSWTEISRTRYSCSTSRASACIPSTRGCCSACSIGWSSAGRPSS